MTRLKIAHLLFYVSECTFPAISQQLKTRQAMYCTYNVTARRVSLNFVTVEKQNVLRFMSVCFSVRYPACKEHVPYCHLWPAPLYGIFFTLSHKRQDFRKKVIEHKMCVLMFSTTFIRKHFSFWEELSEI